MWAHWEAFEQEKDGLKLAGPAGAAHKACPAGHSGPASSARSAVSTAILRAGRLSTAGVRGGLRRPWSPPGSMSSPPPFTRFHSQRRILTELQGVSPALVEVGHRGGQVGSVRASMGSSGPGGRAEGRRPVLCGSQGAVTRPAVGGVLAMPGVGVLTLHLCSPPTGALLPEQVGARAGRHWLHLGAQPHREPERDPTGTGSGCRHRCAYEGAPLVSHCDPVGCSPQPPPSVGFSRQEHRGGLPCPPPQGLKCSTTKNINPSNKNSPQTVKQAQASYLVLPSKPPRPRC